MAEGTNVGALKEVFRTNAPYSGGRTCGGGGCPAIYETDDGVFLIVGRKLTAEEKMGLSMDAIEDALEIPAELLRGIVEKLK